MGANRSIGSLPKPDYLLDYFAGLFRKRIDTFNSRPKYRLELNLRRFFFHRKKNAKMQPLLNMKKNRFWKGGRIFFPFFPKKEPILFFKRTGKKTGFGRPPIHSNNKKIIFIFSFCYTFIMQKKT